MLGWLDFWRQPRIKKKYCNIYVYINLFINMYIYIYIYMYIKSVGIACKAMV